MVKNKKRILVKQSEQGQLAMEAMLIVMLLVSLAIVGSREIRNRNLMGKIVSGPWRDISGMMETGNWKSAQSAMDANEHPHVGTITRQGDR